jgi:gluconokinase
MLLLLMGVTASGKTTVGHLLSEHLGWTFYDGDDFHPPANVEKMSHGIPLTDEDRAPWLATLHKLLADAEQRGESAILACSALKAAYRRVLCDGLHTLRIVFLKGDPETLQHRLDQRVGHFMPKTMLPSKMAALEEPTDPGVIVVNAALPPDVLVQQILNAIGHSRAEL